MIASIRLNKQTKAIKVVNRTSNIRLQHTRGAQVRLQHTGKTGPVGRTGNTGPDGKSAYELAVINGFIGTEQEWLTSLVGPQGPEGQVQADKNYLTSFTVSADVLVQHNLGKYPSVSVIDSAGEEVEGDVEYLSTSALRLRFAAPFSGQVTCN